MSMQPENVRSDEGNADSSRRSLFKWAGATAAAAVIFGVDVRGLRLTEAFAQAAPIDVGAGDIGVLNYAYALEQLEAAYYTQVLATPYVGMSKYEHALLSDIKAHEIAHREFFKKALGAQRIPDLTPNFSKVDFADRRSVLVTAQTFEDTGVAAYNGGGPAIKNPAYLAAAGTIVSVEGRHAATLRDMLGPFTDNFANGQVVDALGLDVGFIPSEILPKVAPYLATPISARSLP